MMKSRTFLKIKSPKYNGSIYVSGDDYGFTSVDEFLNIKINSFVDSQDMLCVPIFPQGWTYVGCVSKCALSIVTVPVIVG